MRRDDRDDPFDEFFEEIERLMNEMMHDADVHVERGPATAGGDDERDVHFDVYDEGDTLRVVADLPGIEKSDIDLKCDGEVLTIDAASTRREYQERIALPRRVDEHTADATYNNGILDVEFAVDDRSADIDLD